MKRCTNCQVPKPVTEFYFRRKHRNERHPQCSECTKGKAVRKAIRQRKENEARRIQAHPSAVEWYGMTQFKVGDRIAVYDATESGTHRTVGTVKEIDYGLIRFAPDVPSLTHTWFIHPKQCRKLKPKRVAREWWVNVYPGDIWGSHWHSKKEANARAVSSRTECVRVREVL